MFTGIVEEIGTVEAISFNPCILQVTADLVLQDVKLGDSISVNGTCLTVTEFNKTCFKVGISPETLDKTCLGSLAVGSLVSLERAMLATSRLGGHIVQGHIDCTVTITSIIPVENSLVYTFSIDDPELIVMIVKKGYVCLDGVSLTVTQVDHSMKTFCIMMIEYTQSKGKSCSYCSGTIKKDCRRRCEFRG